MRVPSCCLAKRHLSRLDNELASKNKLGMPSRQVFEVKKLFEGVIVGSLWVPFNFHVAGAVQLRGLGLVPCNKPSDNIESNSFSTLVSWIVNLDHWHSCHRVGGHRLSCSKSRTRVNPVHLERRFFRLLFALMIHKSHVCQNSELIVMKTIVAHTRIEAISELLNESLNYYSREWIMNGRQVYFRGESRLRQALDDERKQPKLWWLKGMKNKSE